MIRNIASIGALIALVTVAGCASLPPSLDLSLAQATAEKRFVVTLLPPATPAAINQIHSWQTKLASPSGMPITHAQIAVDGGMPQHGHGLRGVHRSRGCDHQCPEGRVQLSGSFR